MKPPALGASAMLNYPPCLGSSARPLLSWRQRPLNGPPSIRTFATSKPSLATRSAKHKVYTSIAAAEVDFADLNIRNPRDPYTRLPLSMRADSARQRIRLGQPLKAGDEETLRQAQAMSLGIAAARAIDVTGKQEDDDPKKPFVRLVPASPAYYSRVPTYVMELLHARSLLREYKTLPRVRPGTERKLKWLHARKFVDAYHEVVSPSKFERLIRVLRRLNQIVPSMRPPAVEEVIQRWALDEIEPRQPSKVPIPDKYGRTRANGGRKTANASAMLVQGTGEIYVNGKTVAEFFSRVHDRETVVWALKWTNRLHKYNVWAQVKGGGTTGQAEAVAQAVGKSLIGQEPLLKKWVRKVGCLSRDRRTVERKKPGRLKARKKPAWVKR